MRVTNLLVAIILVILIGSLVANPAAAQVYSTATWQGYWMGIVMSVAVVARGHTISEEIKQASPWWQWGNTISDAYLFSFTDPSSVDLILEFSQQESHPQVTIYVLKSEYRNQVLLQTGGYSLPPKAQPYLVIWPRQGDWLVDGKANFNLNVNEIDIETGDYNREIYVGSDRPGIPQWSTSTLSKDPHPSWGYQRFGASLLADPAISYQLAEPLMPSWPYLSAGHNEIPYGATETHPLYFNIESHELSQTWAGFQSAGLFAVNSLTYPPYTDFESPFAWYRFDHSFGNLPNLAVRSEIWPVETRNRFPSMAGNPTAIRYSWTGEKPPFAWRYSLSVIGDNRMDEPVTIGNTSIYSIPYWELPSWVVLNSWGAVTFIEATNSDYFGSEGIYDYSVQGNEPVFQWLKGSLDNPPDIFHSPFLRYKNIDPQRLKENLRGEYSLMYNQAPYLYFSPIDNRLHLLNGEEGIWNLDNRTILRSFNLQNSPYTNAWLREQISADETNKTSESYQSVPGNIIEQLYALNGYVIYSGLTGVTLQKSDYSLAGFEVKPPTDKVSWTNFFEQLKPFQGQERDPYNLQSWLKTDPIISLSISNATILSFRALSSGFRFELILEPGYDHQGFEILDFGGKNPGQYVVSYNGKFNVESLTPANLSLILKVLETKDLKPGDLVPIQIETQNTGLGDVKNLVLMGEAENGIEIAELGQKTIAVPSNENTRATFDWQPTKPGVWRLRFWMEDASGNRLAETSSAINIPPQKNTLFSRSNEMGQYLPAFFVLLVVAGLIGMLFRHMLNPEVRS